MIKKTLAIFGLVLLTLTACNNKKTKTAIPVTDTTKVAFVEKTVAEVLSPSDNLVGKQVKLKGVVAHVCHNTGLRLFLKGEKEGDLIRVESTPKLGKLPISLEENEVVVLGTVEEKRVDEAYLKSWEERIRKNSKEASECNTEKASRHIKGQTAQDQIASYREKIAHRMEKEGKNYVSFSLSKHKV